MNGQEDLNEILNRLSPSGSQNQQKDELETILNRLSPSGSQASEQPKEDLTQIINRLSPLKPEEPEWIAKRRTEIEAQLPPKDDYWALPKPQWPEKERLTLKGLGQEAVKTLEGITEAAIAIPTGINAWIGSLIGRAGKSLGSGL